MSRNITPIIITLFLVSNSLVAQKRDLTTYKYGDSMLVQRITKNLFQYHDKEIVFEEKNAFILSIVSISKEGKIIFVNTLNDSNSIISKAIIDAINRTKNEWIKGKESYKIIIPIYVLHSETDSGKITLDVNNFIPVNTNLFPLKAIIIKPIFIQIGPRISLR